MQKKSVIVTPNRRLARYLQHTFSVKLSKEKKSWRSIKILPLTAWLTDHWLNCLDVRVVLNKHQERLLWHQVVIENLGKEYIHLVETIMDANNLAIDWQLNESCWTNYETEASRVFKQLIGKFKEKCNQKNFIILRQLPSLLATKIQADNLEITFAGFDEFEPNLQTLISNLQKSGSKITYYSPNEYQNSVSKKISFNNQLEEITTIAVWSKQHIQQSAQSKIGIVVPNLINLRTDIIQIFTEVFDGTKYFNISAGENFSSLLIINNALELLKPSYRFDFKIITKLLLSPYIVGAISEKSSRALFDREIKHFNQSSFLLTEIKTVAQKCSINIPLLLCALQKKEDLYRNVQHKKMYCSEWAKIFVQMLEIFGWPGENNLTQTEVETVERFNLLIQEFSAINTVIDKISYIQALQVLHDIADHIMFQPSTNQNVPINILGVLETTGINYHYLWVMGMDQENWPTPPSPNPFIPIQIQTAIGLPHSSADRELHFCRTFTKMFQRSAKEIIFSHVKYQDDRIVEPSSLIEDIPIISYDNLSLLESITITQKIFRSKKIENISDDLAVKLMTDETVNGGSRLLELQSLCPFRAFAEFRLAAKEPRLFELGVTKIERGMLVHAALENFWQNIKNQQRLCQLSENQLVNEIKKSINHALNKIKIKKSLFYLEQQCLMRLLIPWFETEKNRPAFAVVTTEQSVLVNIGPIQIRIRIDRIDRLINNDLLVIDYKTGKNLPGIFSWFDNRPENIQLPLYCISNNKIKGLAFGHINVESIKFKPITMEELNFAWQHSLKSLSNELKKKNNITWNELITYWHDILIKLANDFVGGLAHPNPLSPKVCRQCEFKILCRI